MIKQGMERPERTHTKSKNDTPPVPELQGRAKSSSQPANLIGSATSGSSQKVFYPESPISPAYRSIDSDLARDNLENDLPDADLQDL